MKYLLTILATLLFSNLVSGTNYCFELEDSPGLCDGIQAEVIKFDEAVGLYDGFEGINFWPIENGDSIYLAGTREITNGAEPLLMKEDDTTWIGLNGEIRNIFPNPITENCIQKYSPLQIGGDNVLVQNLTVIRRIDTIPTKHKCSNITTIYPVGIGGDHVTLDNVIVSFKGRGWTGRGCGAPCPYSADDCIKLTGTINGGGNNFTLKNSLIKQCGESGIDAVGEDNGIIENNLFTRMLETGISIKGGSQNWIIRDNIFSWTKYHPIYLGGTSDGAYQESCDYHVKNAFVYNNTVYGRTKPAWGNYLNLGFKIAGVDSLFSYGNIFIEASVDTTTGIVLNGCGSMVHKIYNGYIELD